MFDKEDRSSDPYYADAIPTTDWECHEWVIWHKALVQKYGRQRANDKFKVVWDGLSTWSYDYNFCKYNSDFAHYFLTQGLDIRSWASALVTNATGLVVDTTDSAVQVADSTGDAALRTANMAKFILPVSLIALVGVGGLILYKNGTAFSSVVTSFGRKPKK